jgi:hypothetical protein
MNRDPNVDELLAPMRQDLNAKDAAPIDRERIVARMMDAARPEPKATARRWVVAFAVAAAFAVGFGAMRWLRKPADAERSLDVVAVAGEVTWLGAREGTKVMSPGQSGRIESGGTVTTSPSGAAEVRTAGGLELDLSRDTRVGLAAFEGPSRTLQLVRGKVLCRVPHLAEKETFSVVTSDVRVVVHGTVFSVEVSPEGTITVRVDQGVVSVHHPRGDVTLVASQSWSSEPTPAPAAPPPLSVVQEGKEGPPKVSAPAARKAGEPAPPPGTLDEETRLLRSGLAAERSGDLESAAQSFDQLLKRFPQSPLAPDARAALARVRSHQRTTP